MGKSAAGERRSARPKNSTRRVTAKAAADKTNGSRDAAAARANILAIATEEFSKKGLSGSRVDEIAERTHTVKRMIYYYFGSKDGLYRAVLERAYEDIRSLEVSLDLDAMAPAEALRALVRATFDYHTKHPDFVRLVMNENIHHGDHIGHLSIIKARRSTVLVMLRKLIDRGVAARVFRKDLDPIEVHMSMSALCFYNVSNRYTFSRIFDIDMTSPKAVAARREIVVDMMDRWCRA
jgi:AcrR family transcriptional regulator